jgi:hypothetical protein
MNRRLEARLDKIEKQLKAETEPPPPVPPELQPLVVQIAALRLRLNRIRRALKAKNALLRRKLNGY